jgi:N4-gp56 family major capsid protein
MAITVISSSDNKAAKLWAKSLFRDTLAKTWYKKFMGEGSGSIIQVLPETKKSRGDKVTYALRMQLSGAGRTGQQVLENNEEDLSFYDAAVYIDLMRHAVKIDTTITQQRVEYDLRRESRDALSDWWAARLDDYMFRYLAGDTSLTFAANTAVSADSSHVVYASTCTSEAELTTAMTFSLSLIDKAVKKAKTVSPLMRPINIDGDSYYAVVLHPSQVYDLRADTSTGQWLDIQKAALQGGKMENPIFKGSLGTYNGCILYEASRVHVGTYGASSANVYRSLLLGAQAGVIAFGQQGGIDQFSWEEETFDYGKNLGVAASCTWGIQKNIFNSLDYGVITIATGATA